MLKVSLNFYFDCVSKTWANKLQATVPPMIPPPLTMPSLLVIAAVKAVIQVLLRQLWFTFHQAHTALVLH